MINKIPVRIHPFFWLLAAMIGWLNSFSFIGVAIWVVAIFFSILVHEYGHALTAAFFGQKSEISLVAFGGLTTRRGAQTTAWKEFLIVLNGPVFGFLLFLLVFSSYGYIAVMGKYYAYTMAVLVQINLFWTIFNLLPVLPLDGGQLMRIMLQKLFGQSRGGKLSLLSSFCLAAFLSAIFLLYSFLFVGFIFAMFALESLRGYRDAKDFSEVDSNDYYQNLLQTGLQKVEQNDLNNALRCFEEVRNNVSTGYTYILATEEYARIKAMQGLFKEAYDALLPTRNKLRDEYLVLLQNLSYRLEEWEHTVQIGALAFSRTKSFEVAVTNAYASAIMGRVKETVGWLQSSHNIKKLDLKDLSERREFQLVKESPEFKNFLAKNSSA